MRIERNNKDMKKKRTTKIVESLNALNKTDVYSLLLFTLYKMQDVPEYSTLSELCYILDGDNLSKFLSYFGGMTIKVPTLQEMRLLVQGLLLYQYVNIEQGDYNEALKTLTGDFSQDEIEKVYHKIVEVTQNYDFRRD